MLCLDCFNLAEREREDFQRLCDWLQGDEQ